LAVANRMETGKEPVWMRSIPTSVLCNFWLFFAALGFVYLILLVILQLPMLTTSPIIGISSIIMTTVLLGVVIFQEIGLYLICKRGVPMSEGFRRRRQK
jgi:hypothetical protein